MLVRRCGAGDASAMRELIDRYQRPIYRFLYGLTGSQEDAEDAAVDVFLRAWRSSVRSRGASLVSTWLYRIARRCASDALTRHRRNRGELTMGLRYDEDRGEELTEALAVHNLEAEVLARELRRALARLREDDRYLLALYYLEDQSYENIQAIVGCSRDVLKTRLARARARLRRLMESDQGGGVRQSAEWME